MPVQSFAKLTNYHREDEFKVSQTELTLGSYYLVYEEVLVNHMKPTNDILPVMYQAIELFLKMQIENNAVTRYILKNKKLHTFELLKRLFVVFPTVGYGD